MNSIKKILVVSLLLLLVTTSCDKDFEEINKDPNNPTAVSSGLLLADIVRVTANRMYSTFTGFDMGSEWSQQIAKVQYNDEARYSPRGGVITATWDNLFEDVAADAKEMYNLAVTEENANMQGAALIMQAYGFSLLTDMYGDIPFTEAGKAKEGILSPKYDDQQTVYNGILALLDQANALLGTGGTINNASDIMYGGDAAKWKMFGNSLKFRALMRMSSKVDVSADLQALVSAGGMFTSNDAEAKVTYLSADPNANPIYETVIFGTRAEFKVCEVMIDMLDATGDPRLAVYAQPNEDGVYRGKPAGLRDVPSDDYNYGNVSAIGEKYLAPEAPAYFMSYAQLQFLMAEAATKGYIGGSAQDFYNAGVNASLAANGVSGLTPETLSGTTNEALEQIGNQAWIAMFCQGVESWTEQRRTGFPVLTPALEGTINEIPSRYTYPNEEQSLNSTSWSEAVARQGADALTTKIWWNK